MPPVSTAAPRIEINLEVIAANTRALVELGGRRGMSILGVTKGCCGSPEVARAMLAGGVRAIGDSRLENLRRLRAGGIDAPLYMLRLPMKSEARAAAELADGSLNSEPEVLRALSDAALAAGRRHRVIIMVDLGDRREGVPVDQALPLLVEVLSLPGLVLEGIGTNLTCFAGVIPTPENLERLVDIAERLRQETGFALTVVSGGNSSSVPLLLEGRIPDGINHLRLGEAILLGRETAFGTPIPGTGPDAFRLWAEVIEAKEKPSVPEGEIGFDTFGDVPRFTDRGIRLRAILAIGRQDVRPEGLVPLVPGIEVLGASSDHLILDVGDAGRTVAVGDQIPFAVNYGALLMAMTSAYVHKFWNPGGEQHE